MAQSTIDPVQSQQDLIDYLDTQSPNPSVEAFVFHHCYRPNQAQYRGRSTILGVKRFHMQSRGLLSSSSVEEEFIREFGFNPMQNDLLPELQWDELPEGERGYRDIAAHLYATPEGEVKWYTARPLSTRNGAHAYVSRSWSSVPRHARRLCGRDRQYFNEKGFGLEMVADFTSESWKTMPQVLRNGILSAATVLDYFDLPTENIIVHNDVANKPCPSVPREFLMSEVDKVRGGDVDVDEYAQPAVDWAKGKGYMSGYSADEFGGRDPIRRQDVPIVMRRMYDDLVGEIEDLKTEVERLKSSRSPLGPGPYKGDSIPGG